MEKLQLTDFASYCSLSGLELAPDAKRAAFIVKKADLKQNDYASDICVCSLDTGTLAWLTMGRRVIAIDWLADSARLLFTERVRGEEGLLRTAAYEIAIQGGEALHSFTLAGLVPCIRVLDGRRVLYLMQDDVNPDAGLWTEGDCMVADELPIWRDGDGFVNKKRLHLYLFDREAHRSQQLTGGYLNVEAFDVRDERVVLVGTDYDQVAPLRNDLYLLELTNGTLRRLTAQTHWFLEPRFLSADVVAVLGSDMARYRLRQNKEVYALHLSDGRLESLTPGWDKSDRQHCVVTDVRLGSAAISRAAGGRYYCVTLEDCSAYLTAVDAQGSVTRLVDEPGSVDDFDVKQDTVVYVAMRDTHLQELYTLQGGVEKQLTALNAETLADKAVVTPEHLAVRTAEDVVVDAWLIRPVGYEPGRRYPAVLFIHGGPKAVGSPIFRQEHQMLANQGYAVLQCNPRGSDGRGDAFHGTILGGFGTVDYDDIMAVVDHVLDHYDFLDPERMGVTGSSYGGFMVNWIIGHTPRFRAAVSVNGIADMLSMFGTTEIGYYWMEQYLKATPWEDIEKYWLQSPLRYADRVTTPTLFLESEQDYVCGLPQALEMFTALKHFGVETRLCIFRGEAHGVVSGGKPKNRIRYWKEMLAWFDSHLKGQPPRTAVGGEGSLRTAPSAEQFR